MLIISKKILLTLLIIFIFFIFLELLSKILNNSLLKNKINPDNLKTEFEEIYVPPFEKKQPDEYRVFVYGGSSVQGLPQPKLGFVNQLDWQIHHVFEGKNIKVFNFGWAGFNSTRIRYFFERTIPQDPDLIIIYTGENEFIYPQLDFYFLVRSVTALKNRTDLAKLGMMMTKRNESSELSKQSSLDKKLPAYGANKIFVNLKMQIFQNNLRQIVRLAQKNRVPLIIGIPASNIKDMPPVAIESTSKPLPKNYSGYFQRVSKLIGENRLPEANNLVDKALSLYPNDASFLYLEAQVAHKSGKDARELFIKARDADLIPWRTTSAHINFLKSLEDKKTVWVVDLNEALSENSNAHLIGFNLLLDGTHPNKEGAYLISNTILDFIKKERLINRQWLKDSKSPYSMEKLFEVLNVNQQDDLFVYVRTAELLLKRPLFNLNAAKFYIEKAEEIDQKNWEAKAVKASIFHLESDDIQAKTFLKEAEKLKGSPIKKQDVNFIPYLSEILRD